MKAFSILNISLIVLAQFALTSLASAACVDRADIHSFDSVKTTITSTELCDRLAITEQMLNREWVLVFIRKNPALGFDSQMGGLWSHMWEVPTSEDRHPRGVILCRGPNQMASGVPVIAGSNFRGFSRDTRGTHNTIETSDPYGNNGRRMLVAAFSRATVVHLSALIFDEFGREVGVAAFLPRGNRIFEPPASFMRDPSTVFNTANGPVRPCQGLRR